MSQIFISHSSRDDAFTRHLVHSLQNDLGAEIWVDFLHNIGAMKWSAGIENALKECEIMILVYSPDAMASRNVEDEWQYFLDKEKPLILVPCRPVDEYPFQLNRWLRIHFYGRDYETAFGELCAALRNAGVQPKSNPELIQINRQKTGNLFWLCHDLMELYRWLLSSIPREWLNVGFRQSHHHANELGLNETILSQLRKLKDEADSIEVWTQERREQFAGEVKTVFNLIAQIAQGADPDFVSGAG